MNFYVLDCVRIYFNTFGYFTFRPEVENHGPFPLCPSCGARIGVMAWESPFLVTLEGERAGDICCGAGHEFLVTRRFMETWGRSGLTGMTIGETPVEIVPPTKLSGPLPQYYVATPSHTITRLDDAASGMEVRKLVGCDACRVVQRSWVRQLRIDESSWTGEDIFYPSGLYGRLIVTERFHQFVEVHGFTNFVFIHQDDFREEWR